MFNKLECIKTLFFVRGEITNEIKKYLSNIINKLWK